MIRFSGFEDLPTSLINTIVNTALRVSFSININYRFITIYSLFPLDMNLFVYLNQELFLPFFFSVLK